jgi:membrane-bound metal-dependent hydrolase YbcI (DUF457 family)
VSGIEHMAIGMAAKPLASKVNVILLMIACEAIDLIIIPFYLVKMNPDTIMALTHGLFMSVVWSLLIGIIAFTVSRDKKTALIFVMVVFSHWVLDFITHPMTAIFPEQVNPDMPLMFADSPKVGIGLYSTMPGVIIANIVLWGSGIAIYVWYRMKQKKAVTGNN